MSPSMDTHLYCHGCAQISFSMTYIYIVCLVAMSKFDSSSHGSMLYSSSNVYSFPSLICLVFICIHNEESFGYE